MSSFQVRSLITRNWSSSCSSHDLQSTSSMSARVRGRVSTRTASEANSVLPSCESCGIRWQFSRRSSGDVRHHSPHSPWQARSLSNSTTPPPTNNTLVRCGLRRSQAQDQSARTTVSQDSTGQWSAGLDHAGPEEASAVRTETEWILGEENHWQQGRSKKVMATTEVCPSTEERQASQFWGAHCWSFLERFRGEAGGRAGVNCVSCTPGFRQTAMHLQFRSVRDHWSLHDTTPHRQRSEQICELDPVPSWVIQKFADELLPFVAALFNASMSSGSFSTTQKTASITPILKKATLDLYDLSNYRPISNLTFLSKLLERAAYEQIVGYLDRFQLLPELQSAYRKYRSTETATIKVKSFGHFGIAKSVAEFEKYAYWSGWRHDVILFVHRCDLCCRYKKGPVKPQGLMQNSVGLSPFQKFHVDLTGPHRKSAKGNNYLLTGICCFTKYLIIVPLRDKTAISVARASVKHVYLIYGAVELIVHDNGGEFVNAIMENITKLMGIQDLRSTSLRPQANSQIERVHRTINSAFAKTVKENQSNWDDRAPYVAFAYTTAKHSSTLFSPFYLVFLREPRVGLHMMIAHQEIVYQSLDDYSESIREKIQRAYKLVADQLDVSFTRAKRRYDQRVKAVRFHVNDLVRFYHPKLHKHRGRKFRLLTSGPFLIVGKINEVIFVIQKTPISKLVTCYIDILLKYESEARTAWKPNSHSVQKQTCTVQTEIQNTPEITLKENTPKPSAFQRLSYCQPRRSPIVTKTKKVGFETNRSIRILSSQPATSTATVFNTSRMARTKHTAGTRAPHGLPPALHPGLAISPEGDLQEKYS